MRFISIKTTLSGLILVAFAGLHAHSAWQGYETLSSSVFAIADLVAAYALFRRLYWARWFGLGIGIVGLLNFLSIEAVLPWSHPMITAQGIAFAILTALLLGRGMAHAFERQAGWSGDSWRLRAASWAAVLNVGSVAMLIRWLDAGWVPSCIGMASVAAILMGALGIALLWARRTAGLLLLGLGAVDGLMLASAAGSMTAQLWRAVDQPLWGCHTLSLRDAHLFQLVDSAMVTTALVPALVATLVAVVAFAGPAWRFVCGRRAS